jgi:AcrR family transcriptional regulator
VLSVLTNTVSVNRSEGRLPTVRVRGRETLTKDRLYARALAIVDEEGLEALTMRRLAQDVGVKAASLYNHVPSKEALLDGALALMRSEMRLPEPLPDDWMDLMEAIFSAYRQVLAAHPNMMPFAGRRLEGDSGLAFLRERGFERDQAVELWQSLVALVVGFSVMSSGLMETETRGLASEFIERVTEWRDETCTKTLQMIMRGYDAERSGSLHPGKDGLP